MAKLEYGKDYTIILSLIIQGGGGIVLLIFSGVFAFIIFPVFLFYLTALQLYSGVALSTMIWDRRLIAKYTKEGEPFMFYLNVIQSFIGGVVTLWFTLWIFEQAGLIGQK